MRPRGRRASVPGEGIEPSRAEAHGFLRPARLPIPPSRPGRPSVPARALLTVAGALLASAGCGGSPAPDDAPRIAFLFDGSWGEADEVAGPTLAGLRFAALDTGDPETIQPVNLGEGLAILREVAADPNVVATVVAPWTAAPPAATGLLVETEMPVVSLAWAWGRPSAEAPWIRLAPDLAADVVLCFSDAMRSVVSKLEPTAVRSGDLG